jgi:Na+-transporting methylmalonyl-CoA/oxaloacetate decarboxylase gamma subunit/RNA polymerase subunit RPABC4/transcription elongation factor Spt4
MPASDTNDIIHCPSCKRVLPPGTKFCGYCGGSVNKAGQINCASCGKLVSQAFQFCSYCGAASPREKKDQEPSNRPGHRDDAAEQSIQLQSARALLKSPKLLVGIAGALLVLLMVVIAVENSGKIATSKAIPSATSAQSNSSASARLKYTDQERLNEVVRVAAFAEGGRWFSSEHFPDGQVLWLGEDTFVDTSEIRQFICRSQLKQDMFDYVLGHIHGSEVMVTLPISCVGSSGQSAKQVRSFSSQTDRVLRAQLAATTACDKSPSETTCRQMNPWLVLQQPDVRELTKLVFGDDAPLFSDWGGVMSLTPTGDIVTITTCRQHYCGDFGGILSIDLRNGKGAGALYRESRIVVYLGDYGTYDELPVPLREEISGQEGTKEIASRHGSSWQLH